MRSFWQVHRPIRQSSLMRTSRGLSWSFQEDKFVGQQCFAAPKPFGVVSGLRLRPNQTRREWVYRTLCRRKWRRVELASGNVSFSVRLYKNNGKMKGICPTMPFLKGRSSFEYGSSSWRSGWLYYSNWSAFLECQSHPQQGGRASMKCVQGHSNRLRRAINTVGHSHSLQRHKRMKSFKSIWWCTLKFVCGMTCYTCHHFRSTLQKTVRFHPNGTASVVVQQKLRLGVSIWTLKVLKQHVVFSFLNCSERWRLKSSSSNGDYITSLSTTLSCRQWCRCDWSSRLLHYVETRCFLLCYRIWRCRWRWKLDVRTVI